MKKTLISYLASLAILLFFGCKKESDVDPLYSCWKCIPEDVYRSPLAIIRLHFGPRGNCKIDFRPASSTVTEYKREANTINIQTMYGNPFRTVYLEYHFSGNYMDVTFKEINGEADGITIRFYKLFSYNKE